MARIAGCILALDGVLVTLDRSGCPPPLAHGADHTDRALHAHATERVLLANMTLRGVTVAPETSTMLEALASRLGLVLLSEQSRAVTHALLAATSWGNHLRAVLCADDVATRPAADGHQAALRRLPRHAEGTVVLAIESTTDGVRAARGAGCIAVACGRPIEGVPFIAQLGDLDDTSLDALLRTTSD
jgi:beta-phosphoglucomutase-like phosphatase (HAD superfamily)